MDGEDWKDFKEELKLKNKLKQYNAQDDAVGWCTENDADYKEIHPHHIRISKSLKVVDVYPNSRKWHNVTSNTRGVYKSLIQFLSIEFKQ